MEKSETEVKEEQSVRVEESKKETGRTGKE